MRSIEKLCTIDIKKEETALKQLSEKLGVPLVAFPAEELKQLAGEFTASKFVDRITGVDNVCERTAVLGSRGELIVRKQALNGVTIAIAARKEDTDGRSNEAEKAEYDNRTRDLVRESRIGKSSLIYPIFWKRGKGSLPK